MSWLSKLGGSVKKMVTSPVKWAENVGRTIGKTSQDIAPYAGLIPGVGPGIGAAMGGLGSVMAGGNMQSHATSALKGGASGLANSQLLGGQGVKGIGAALGIGGGAPAGTAAAEGLGPEVGGSFLGKVGSALGSAGGLLKSGAGSFLGSVGGMLKDAYMPNGKLDLGRILGTAGAASSFIGQGKQRASAEKYNNSQIDQRNKLMEHILSPQNYNLPTISPNGEY